ncbi:hypothetical protein PENSTE_c001G00821 [Penicillium steckii]|uniref:Transcription factor domain-containing protein n=1 Tax=Penicillium steckii TaxID=303698 RepID=A0A1V6TYH6_9EURO|nr:hypothetical protein PENSTE_c001G00821 [Penicillium steckii]
MADLNRDSRARKASSKRSIMINGGIYGNFFQSPEVIPGLSLYIFATVILGQVQVGVKLEHAQAFLLAALYSNQICHPLQAHSWIWQASRACQILIRPGRYEMLEARITQDLVNFVYWSCVQLENEFLAEIDFPESGLSDSESRISQPSGKVILDQPNNLSASKLSKNAEQFRHHGSSVVQNDLEMSLFRWRKSLPRALQWQDAHPPTTYVNAARLRAKYYDMLHLIYRPTLFHVLHCGQTDVPKTSVGKPSVDLSMKSSSVRQIPLDLSSVRTQSMIEPSSPVRRDWKSPTVSAHELTGQHYRSCKICVESAILSAKAFDGIEDRLVLSNIFATAHAQFRKMLVLSAVYDSPIHHLVEGSILEPLLERTIRFLLRNGSISPTLRADARILSEIHERIFEGALSDI